LWISGSRFSSHVSEWFGGGDIKSGDQLVLASGSPISFLCAILLKFSFIGIFPKA
jgi:hypothetical protein